MAFGDVSGSEDTSGVDEGLTPIYTDDTDFKDLTYFTRSAAPKMGHPDVCGWFRDNNDNGNRSGDR
jgi:hypothetical protein